jgi:hypothetical protein
MELAPSKPPVPPSSITERFLTTVAANHISPIPSKTGRKQTGDILETDEDVARHIGVTSIPMSEGFAFEMSRASFYCALPNRRWSLFYFLMSSGVGWGGPGRMETNSRS